MTSWSYRIGTIADINIRVHATFAIIVALAAAGWWSHGISGMAFGAALVILLFACILLHELGHALAARAYNVPVREIILLPIGGIAFLGRAVRNPMQELVIAAAGPAVNVAILAFLVPACWALGVSPAALQSLRVAEQSDPSLGYALAWLASANIGLVLFNMIPAFPLDGGRILRGILGLMTDWSRATAWATATGRYIAIAMGVWAVATGQIMLAFVAIVIFMGASATADEERGRTVLGSHSVGDACNRHALVLSPGDRIDRVVSYILTSYQPDFAVMSGSRLLGVVRRSQVLDALATRSSNLSVTTVMRACPSVGGHLSLDEVRQVLLESGSSVAAVYDSGHYAGLVSLDDIAEAELVLASSRQAQSTMPPASGEARGRRWSRAAAAEA